MPLKRVSKFKQEWSLKLKEEYLSWLEPNALLFEPNVQTIFRSRWHVRRVATRSWSSWNVLEEKKMFLKFEIAKSVLEMFLNFKKYHIFSKKIPYLKRLSKILTYSTIFINLIEQINFIYMLKLSPETEC